MKTMMNGLANGAMYREFCLKGFLSLAIVAIRLVNSGGRIKYESYVFRFG